VHALGRVPRPRGAGPGLGVEDFEEVGERAARRGVGVRARLDRGLCHRITTSDDDGARPAREIGVDADALHVTQRRVGVVGEDALGRVVLAARVEVEPVAVDRKEEVLLRGEAAKEPRVGLASLHEDVEALLGLVDDRERPLVAVAGRDGARDVAAGHREPALRRRLVVPERGETVRFDRELGVARELPHDGAPRRRHAAGIAPRHLEERSSEELGAVEERAVEVVELDHHLVGARVALLVREAEDPPAHIDRRRLRVANVGERGDAHARCTSAGAHESLRRDSPKITSVTTRVEGM
jgi:hypothetical protein